MIQAIFSVSNFRQNCSNWRTFYWINFWKLHEIKGLSQCGIALVYRFIREIFLWWASDLFGELGETFICSPIGHGGSDWNSCCVAIAIQNCVERHTIGWRSPHEEKKRKGGLFSFSFLFWHIVCNKLGRLNIIKSITICKKVILV